MAGELIILCGLPGSGKSYYCQRNYPLAITTDAIRLELGVVFDPSVEKVVWSRAYARLRRLLAKGESVAFDATSVDKRSRAPLIQLGHQFQARVKVVWLDTPLEQCIARNRERPNPVPEEIINRLAAKLQPPDAVEGMDEIEIIRNYS